MIPLVKECESIKCPLCQWGLKYNFKINKKITISLFHVCVPFLYPLKTSENLWFSDVFRGYKNVTLLVWKELTYFRPVFPFYAPWKDQKISSFDLKWNFSICRSLIFVIFKSKKLIKIWRILQIPRLFCCNNYE